MSFVDSQFAHTSCSTVGSKQSSVIAWFTFPPEMDIVATSFFIQRTMIACEVLMWNCLAVRIRFTHIVLDKVRVRTASAGVTDVLVFYLATLEGSIHKMAVLPQSVKGTSPVCLVEIINLADVPTPRLIRSIQLLDGRKVSNYFPSQNVVRFYAQIFMRGADVIMPVWHLLAQLSPQRTWIIFCDIKCVNMGLFMQWLLRCSLRCSLQA